MFEALCSIVKYVDDDTHGKRLDCHGDTKLSLIAMYDSVIISSSLYTSTTIIAPLTRADNIKHAWFMLNDNRWFLENLIFYDSSWMLAFKKNMKRKPYKLSSKVIIDPWHQTFCYLDRQCISSKMLSVKSHGSGVFWSRAAVSRKIFEPEWRKYLRMSTAAWTETQRIVMIEK